MAPHHRKYPPASFQSQASSSDGTLVLAEQREVEASHHFTGNDGKATPHDLIHQETVFMLIEEARHLRQRCVSLEEANAKLKREMHAMEPTHSGLTEPTISGHDKLPSFPESNLSGYASSTSSVSSETAAFGKDSTDGKEGLQDFKDFLNAKIDAMTQILESFETALKAEGVSRYKLSQELERAKQDATKTKGRVGAVEHSMKEVRQDFEELAVSTAEAQRNTDSTTRLGRQDEGQVERMQAELTTALAQLKSLTQEVQTQADAVDELSAQLDGGPIQATPGGHDLTASDFARRINMTKTAGTQSSAELSFLQRNVIRMMRKATMQQTIDEMYSKDRLQDAFQQLSFVLKDADRSSKEVLRTAKFEGTYGEMCSLRDRVVRRLAHQKQNGQAFAETWNAVARS